MSAIYMTNPNSTDILANGIIPININKRVGCAFRYGNNSALIGKPGYYKISASVTFTGSAAGDVSLAVQKNSETIPGITAVETITTADTEYRTVTMQGIIRVLCHEGPVVISLVNTSDIDITTYNVSLSIID